MVELCPDQNLCKNPKSRKSQPDLLPSSTDKGQWEANGAYQEPRNLGVKELNEANTTGPGFDPS